MSNGVEVIVADANGESVSSGTKSKLLRELPTRPLTLAPSTLSNNVRMTIALEDQISPNSTDQQKQSISLLSSSMSTSTEKRSSPQTPILHHGLQLRHNYVVKTCFTTFTYLTTLIHKSRTVVSTYETVVSTVTTEPFQISPTATFSTTKGNPTDDKLFQATKNIFESNILTEKIDEDVLEKQSLDDDNIIEPSEVSPSTSSCSLSSCPCTVTLTESLKNNMKTNEIESTPSQLKRSPPKSSKYGSTIMDIEPSTVKDTDKLKTKIAKPTQNKQSELKDKIDQKINSTKIHENHQNNPEKDSNKPPKTKFQVADLLKLGTLGIKKLAPMIEQMTDNLKRRQEISKQASTTTIRPVTKITPYIVNKRVDSIEAESKSPGNFPIYIPVDDMDIAASEFQDVYANSTLHQNIVWASQNLKTSRTNLAVSKPIHESPLLNGGIPISPGEIITANSDVIVGKPAVGGPNMHHINPPNPIPHPPVDSHIQSSNIQDTRVKPPQPQRGQGLKHIPFIRDDDTYDLRPPMRYAPNTLPPLQMHFNNAKIHDQSSQHSIPIGNHYKPNGNEQNIRPPNNYQVEIVKSESVPYKGGNVIQTVIHSQNQQTAHSDQIGISIQPPLTVLENHGRPALLDYIPSLDSPSSYQNYLKTNAINRKNHELSLQNKNQQGHDNKSNQQGQRRPNNEDPLDKNNNKQFLVDIQPSKVANVIIPHGSTTALVFAGSSEPHKNGQYIDDPLPYSEPGYFGSFSIDAPHLTSIHVGPKQPLPNGNPNINNQRRPINENNNMPLKQKPNPSIVNHGISGFNQDNKPSGPKWKFEQQRPNIPPPSSNQQTTMHFGPHIIMKHEHNIKNHHIPQAPLSPENYYYGNTIKSTTLGYEDELVVPPPPPPNIQVKYESNVGVVNSDFNRFKNDHHNIPQGRPHLPPGPGRPGLYDKQKFATNEIYAPQHINSPAPPRVTSEVYYASTANLDQNKHNKPQQINVPNNQNNFDKHRLNQGVVPHDNIQIPIENGNFINTFNGGLVTLNAGTKVNAPISQHNENSNTHAQSGLTHSGNRYNIPQEGGLITLNAGTSVQGTNFPEQTISGTSIPVSINENSNVFNAHAVKNINTYSGESTGISIGTNFAISVAPQNPGENVVTNVSPVQFKPQSEGPQVIVGGNSWTSSIDDGSDDYVDINTGGVPDNVLNGNQKVHIVHASSYNEYNQSNGQTNFPSIKETTIKSDNTKIKQDSNVKPHTDNNTVNQRPIVIDTRLNSQSSTIENNRKPLNSSVQYENKKQKTIQPKVIATTPKIIPLTYNYENNFVKTEFGQRIPTPGIPPMNYNWQVSVNNNDDVATNKDPSPSEFMSPPPLTTQSYNPSFITNSNNYNTQYPQTHNIPQRGDTKYKPTGPLYATNAINNVETYTNSFPVKTPERRPQVFANQPVASSTPNSIRDVQFKPLKNTSQGKDEILLGSENDYVRYNNEKPRPDFNANHNVGSQTEKPFDEDKYKVVSLVTLPGTRPTSHPAFNRPITQLSPRPFSVSEYKNPITDLPTDLPLPRPFEMPQFDSNKQNVTKFTKETDKIITSSVHLSTNKPIKIVNVSSEKIPSTLPTFTTVSSKNVTMDITDDLSPPPMPTNDYTSNSQNLLNNDETIMGMSPPPKTQSTIPSGEVSTYKPSYNVLKNQYKRPGDYYRITSRPFNRYATASTIMRPKVPVATTITRIVYPSRSSVPNWKNPSRVESNVIKQTITKISPAIPSIINTTPLTTVGSDIMHPEVYPEETLGVVVPSSAVSKPSIFPSRIQPTGIFATVITNSNSGIGSPSIISAPSVVQYPSLIQSSFNEHQYRPTESFKPTENLKTYQTADVSSSRRVIRPPMTVTPILQTAGNELDEISVIPLNHNNNNRVRQSSEVNRKPSEQITVVTHTTTLAEPASTIMTTRFVTLTHTLTVTQTKTSLVSPVVGSTTQTLVLTNTQTSTVVDIVTEIHTLVQPTTIVQTVTKHVPLETLPAWETKYPKVPIEPTNVRIPQHKTHNPVDLDDVSLSSDEEDFIIHPDNSTDLQLQNNETEQSDNDNFFVVMNKSQNGGNSNNVNVNINNINQDSQDFDGATRNEEANNDGVSHVLLGEILLAGTPYHESPHPISPTGAAYGKECQPDCKASRNERCQRVDGMMKCVCRPGFARMFPDRPCKPTYTYSMKLALSRHGNERLLYQESLADQNTPDFQALAVAAHEGINRMVMQSDLRDVYHGVHVNGFQPVDIPTSVEGSTYKGVINDFYVQLSDNAHEDRLKDVIEKYLRNNNYSLGGTDVFAASELVDKLEVGDFNECMSPQFHDCSEHAECFNLRATYTCSCREGYADLSVNPQYPGRVCSADSIGCEKCHYHGTCYSRDDNKVLCECFQWYAGESCQVNLKVILISLATLGAILLLMLIICMAMTCARRKKGGNRPPSQSRPANIMASCLTPIHQGAIQSSKMHPPLDKRALIQERGNDSGGEGSSVQNMSIPYAPAKKMSQASQKSGKKTSMTMEEGQRDKKPFTLMIPRAKYCPAPVASPLNSEHRDSNAGLKRKPSNSEIAESKLLSYLDAGPSGNDNLIRRKQSNESSYSITKTAHQKYSSGALVSAGFKVSTTVMGGGDGDSCMKELQDDNSSITKSNNYGIMDIQSQFNSLRKAYSQEDINDWTDAERRIGELTMSEARSFDGTLVKPSTKIIRSTTGSNKSSAHYTQHEANTMAERDLGSTFLLPHVHLYKPDLGSDGSEFDSI